MENTTDRKERIETVWEGGKRTKTSHGMISCWSKRRRREVKDKKEE